MPETSPAPPDTRGPGPFPWSSPPGVRRAYRGGVAQILGGPDLIPDSDQLVFSAAPTGQYPERVHVTVKARRAGRRTPGNPPRNVCHINYSFPHHQRAFREGWDAARAGHMRVHCPYTRRSVYGKHWLRGWYGAAEAATEATEAATETVTTETSQPPIN